MEVNLSIKGVPQDLAERLRARAACNHRSLQGELMHIIQQAAAQADGAAVSEPRGASSHADTARRGTKTIEQTAAEHRMRFPRPISTGPLAVDIVRADRDAR